MIQIFYVLMDFQSINLIYNLNVKIKMNILSKYKRIKLRVM